MLLPLIDVSCDIQSSAMPTRYKRLRRYAAYAATLLRAATCARCCFAALYAFASAVLITPLTL